MKFKRPDNVPFPSVWDRFEGKIPIDGKLLTYVIQDVTDDLIEPIVDHMTRYFLIREIMTSSLGFVEDEVSLQELRDAYTELLKTRMGIVALVEGEGDPAKRIAGCNVTYVAHKDDPKPKYKGEVMNKICRSMDDLYYKYNLFEKYGVDQYLSAFGLSVSPKYTGDDVGYHLLRARTPLCQATGITLTVTCFSSPPAIHQALKDGFHHIIETTFEEYKIDGQIGYPRLKGPFVLSVKIIPKPE